MKHVLLKSIVAMTYKNKSDILYDYVSYYNMRLPYYGSGNGLSLQHFRPQCKINKNTIKMISDSNQKCIKDRIPHHNKQFLRGGK